MVLIMGIRPALRRCAHAAHDQEHIKNFVTYAFNKDKRIPLGPRVQSPMKYVSPSVKETAFNCPHCGALARQTWLSIHADAMKKDGLPLVIGPEQLAGMKFDRIEDADEREKTRSFFEGKAKGRPYLRENSAYRPANIENLWISRCFNCSELAIWMCAQMIYPQKGEAPTANPDLPADIRRDYDEASAILDLSPRGAAALVRLAIQKLCKHLGQPGENINADIKALVASGLDPRVQKALDAVRVIGNHAVHPGQIDLRDDRAIAESLFRLLNLVAEKMISEPKHVDEVYAMLPEGARKAIEKRDEK